MDACRLALYVKQFSFLPLRSQAGTFNIFVPAAALAGRNIFVPAAALAGGDVQQPGNRGVRAVREGPLPAGARADELPRLQARLRLQLHGRGDMHRVRRQLLQPRLWCAPLSGQVGKLLHV
eukprot:6837533-Pyramimonas_sp.AAC.1